MPTSGRNLLWTFVRDTVAHDIVTHGSYTTSGDALAGITLVRSGARLLQTYRFVFEEDLRVGRLVEVLKNRGGASRPFFLLYPHARYLSSRVRAFVDYIVQQLGHE